MLIALLRVVIAGGGGWLAVRLLGGSASLFTVQAAALVVYGLGSVMAVAGGVWFTKPRSIAQPQVVAR
jgi:hypothetical protein